MFSVNNILSKSNQSSKILTQAVIAVNLILNATTNIKSDKIFIKIKPAE